MTAADSPSSEPSAPSDERLDLVLLGNLLVDDIVLRSGQTLMGEPGGAVLHAALSASLWGLRTGVAAVVGDDYPQHALDALAARGVDLAGVRRREGPGGRTWLLHEPRVRRCVHHLDAPPHEQVSPAAEDLPAGYRSAGAFHLAPMPLARQTELASALDAAPFISLDPFELLWDHNLDDWAPLLSRVDAFFPSEDELQIAADPVAVLPRLGGGRLRLLGLKGGARGGRLVQCAPHDAQADGNSHVSWSARTTTVVDVTGAGDAFAGGFLAGWLLHGDVVRGVEQGVVSASFALEDWGARGLLAATPAAAEARRTAWFAACPATEARES
jgi:ribokinase